MNEPCVVLPDLSLFKDFIVTYDYDVEAIRFNPHLIHRDCYIARLCAKEQMTLLHSVVIHPAVFILARKVTSSVLK